MKNTSPVHDTLRVFYIIVMIIGSFFIVLSKDIGLGNSRLIAFIPTGVTPIGLFATGLILLEHSKNMSLQGKNIDSAIYGMLSGVCYAIGLLFLQA